MKIYLRNGEVIDDGRCARSLSEDAGWHRGDRVVDHTPDAYPLWPVLLVIALLMLAIVLMALPRAVSL